MLGMRSVEGHKAVLRSKGVRCQSEGMRWGAVRAEGASLSSDLSSRAPLGSPALNACPAPHERERACKHNT